MENKLLFIITFLFLVLISPFIWADTHPATSCKQEDVQAAINLASPGDTVIVPAGTETWSSAIPIRKAISIIGAGLNNEKTILTAGGPMPEGFFFIYGFTADTQVRVAGFEFNSVDWSRTFAILMDGLLNSYSSSKIRIDHNRFSYGLYSIMFRHPIGLIDNNIFSNCMTAFKIVTSRDDADLSWSDMSAGTEKAVFIEDNYFISDNNYPETYTQEQIGSEAGGKLVIRYNTFDSDSISLGDSKPTCSIMLHGNADGGSGGGGYWEIDDATTRLRRRGQSVVEIYNNVAHGRRIDFIAMRGSANLIYNNSITGTLSYNPRISFAEEEYWSTLFPIKRTAWPAEDQVHNTFIWNNTYRGHDFNDGVYGFIYAEPNDLLAGLWKNRDYFLHEPQPTGGKEYFIGRNGASNTYPTDGIIYPTLGTMKFTADGPNAYYPYVPYVYPHPLTVQSEPGRLLGLSGTRVTGGTRLAWSAITGAVSYAVQRDWGTKTSVGAGVLTYTDNANGAMYLVEALDAAGKILACEGTLINTVAQVFSLSAGWNWISFNMLPADLSLNSVFNTILTQVEQVKGQSQSAIRSGNVWKGDLANMSSIRQYKMYKVKVSQACTLTVTGTAVLSATPIPLVAGWNWVAYLPTTAIAISTALDSIKGQVQEVKSLTQSATYNGTTWSGTLTQLEPGQGYSIKMSAPGTLIYPDVGAYNHTPILRKE